MAEPIDPTDERAVDLEPIIGSNVVTPQNLERLQHGLTSWRTFRKTALTQALRIKGPFEVVYEPGGTHVLCEDGYVGVDARGYPYQIAKDEFDAIYEPADTSLGVAGDALDFIIRAQARVATLGRTRETALVATKLDEAKMWLLSATSQVEVDGRIVPGTVVHPPTTGGPHT